MASFLAVACAEPYAYEETAGGGEGTGGSEDGGSEGDDGSGNLEGCENPGPADPEFGAEEWARIWCHAGLGEPPPDPTNKYYEREDAARLGQKLFFEKGYALERDPTRPHVRGGKIENCATCHNPDEWFQLVTNAPENGDPYRNKPTLVNTAFYDWYSWDGKRDSLWAQVLFASEKPMGSDRLTIARVVLTTYRAEYEAVFADQELDVEELFSRLDDALPGWRDLSATPIELEDGDAANAVANWTTLEAAGLDDEVNQVFANFGKAIAAYQRKLVSANSKFDRYLAREPGVDLTESQKRGLRLFVLELPCAECHAGPAFTDNDFHNIGSATPGHNAEGRYKASGEVLKDPFNTNGMYSDDPSTGKIDGLDMEVEADRGRFRTKHLRQVEKTGQYMHEGQMTDLRAVVEYYRDGGSSAAEGTLDERLAEIEAAGLSDQDVLDIVAFLETLTGDEIPEELCQDPN